MKLMNVTMPFAGDNTSVLPFILIGVAVALVVGAVIFNIMNKKKH